MVGGIGNTNEYGGGCQVEKSIVVGGIINGNEYGRNCKVGKGRVIGGIVNFDLYENDCKINISKMTGLCNLHKNGKEFKFGLLERSVINED